MPEVPEWLKPILQQFPIVTLCLVAMMLGVWWLNKRHKEELERINAANERMREDIQKRTNLELDRMQKSEAVVQSRASAELDRMLITEAELRKNHLAELTRMNELFKEQITNLQQRIREFETKGTGRKSS